MATATGRQSGGNRAKNRNHITASKQKTGTQGLRANINRRNGSNAGIEASVFEATTTLRQPNRLEPTQVNQPCCFTVYTGT